MANFVVDIGNTALKAAWADGVTLGKTYRYQGERMLDFILSLVSGNRPDVMVLSSSREISQQDEEKLKAVCNVLIVIDSLHKRVYEAKGIPEYITPDRLASVVAAGYLFRDRGCTVFDFGTTLTIDFIAPDGRYSGGNISPGCRTRFKALNRYSRALPLLDTPESVDDIGTSLHASMESGVIKGIMFEVQGYLSLYPGNIVIFTGGDAIYFAKRIKNSIFVVCNLVLMGLAIVAAEYVG